MMKTKSFVKLDLAGDRTAFLLTTLPDDWYEGFQLTLSDGTKVWTGKVTDDDLEAQRKKCKMDLEKYMQHTKAAFTKENTEGVTYRYTLGDKKDGVELAWKRYVPAEDISFLLGSVLLKPCPGNQSQDTVVQMLQFSIDQSRRFKDQVRTLETDNTRLSQERVNALKRLEKCVVAKEELEKDLYSKFVAVLNAKKEKIRLLKDQLDNGVPASIQSDSEENQLASTSRGTVHTAGEIRGRKDLDQSDGDTSEEDVKPPQSKRSRTKGPKLSQESADDSLVLEERDGTKSKSTVVRRPRRPPGGNKKQTPSKPVLPKVPSDSSSSSTSSKRTSIRKSNSGRANRSSDNIDADDLLDDV